MARSKAAGPFPRLRWLPATMPAGGAVTIELEEGVPVLRASSVVQERIEALLQREREGSLSAEEAEEMDRYEEVDDYLSLVNRVVRSQYVAAGPLNAEGS